MQDFLKDFGYAVRLLRKKPGFTLIVLLTLAVGIGANTAIFSAAEAITLRSLPYAEADRLVFLSSSFPNNTQGNDQFSYVAFTEWQTQSQSFESMAAYQDFVAVNLTGRDEPIRLTTNFITADYFSIFNATAAMGRTFSAEESRVPASSQVAVISYDCWQNVFGSDANIIGRQIELNRTPFTVVGVMQREFRDLDDLSRPAIDVWIPLGLTPTLTGNQLQNRSARTYWGVARLKYGVDIGSAKAETQAIAQRIAEANPATDKGFGLYVESLRDHFFRNLYNPLNLLLIGSGFILLIGCANVANLMLARVADRRKEMAVRAALGATRMRLLRQLLIECLLLSIMAGALGLLLAAWATSLINSWSALQLPDFVRIEINGGVLIASLALSLLTGLIFGLVPALESSRIDIREALNQSSRQAAAFQRNFSRRLLVVAEVSLSFVLLIGAGLMLKSFQTLLNTGVGFRTENLLTLQMDLNGAKYDQSDERVQFAKSLVEKAALLPGIESATLWGPAPIGRATWTMFAAPEGRPINGQEDLTMTWRHATNPGGLGNIGLSILRGRDFTWQDTSDSPPVAIISESVASQFWPGEEALGKRIVRQSPTGLIAITVIGIASDAKHRTRYLPDQGANWAFQPQLDIYQPYTQRANPILVVALRTKADSSSVLSAFRQTVLSLDKDMAVYDIKMVDETLANQSSTLRAIAMLMTVYSVIALFLAALGIYGVLANSVAQRTQEIGIRMALGAQGHNIFRLVIRQGMLLTITGSCIGLFASLLLTRFLASLLFGISATDFFTFISVALLLNLIAFFACFFPARRAMKTDPINALKYE
jgi:putative ABC transport system permease protein